jgi:hypothetical protein
MARGAMQEGCKMEEGRNITRYAFAIILTPILLISFVLLEETAKGSELHYLGNLILNRFFVQIMFAAFIPLAIGAFLLLFSRIEDAPRKLKYILYVITVFSLISTLFVAHSLATVPRGGKQNGFWVSPDTFAGNITRVRDGGYSGDAYQTVFVRNCTTSLVVVDASGPSGDPGYLHVSLHTTKPVNLSGTLHFLIYLYRATDEHRRDYPLDLIFSDTPMNLEGTSWVGKIAAPTLSWGSDNEHERIRLEGYRIAFFLWPRLKGADYGEVVPFTADVTGSFYIIDFRVDSSLQNGMAILLCGVFIGIYVQILLKPIIKSARIKKRGLFAFSKLH